MKLGCLNKFFNVKALVGTFNQEKAHDCETSNFAKVDLKLQSTCECNLMARWLHIVSVGAAWLGAGTALLSEYGCQNIINISAPLQTEICSQYSSPAAYWHYGHLTWTLFSTDALSAVAQHPFSPRHQYLSLSRQFVSFWDPFISRKGYLEYCSWQWVFVLFALCHCPLYP